MIPTKILEKLAIHPLFLQPSHPTSLHVSRGFKHFLCHHPPRAKPVSTAPRNTFGVWHRHGVAQRGDLFTPEPRGAEAGRGAQGMDHRNPQCSTIPIPGKPGPSAGHFTDLDLPKRALEDTWPLGGRGSEETGAAASLKTPIWRKTTRPNSCEAAKRSSCASEDSAPRCDPHGSTDARLNGRAVNIRRASLGDPAACMRCCRRVCDSAGRPDVVV